MQKHTCGKLIFFIFFLTKYRFNCTAYIMGITHKHTPSLRRGYIIYHSGVSPLFEISLDIFSFCFQTVGGRRCHNILYVRTNVFFTTFFYLCYSDFFLLFSKKVLPFLSSFYTIETVGATNRETPTEIKNLNERI